MLCSSPFYEGDLLEPVTLNKISTRV